MFTSGNHFYLYLVFALYLASLSLSFSKKSFFSLSSLFFFIIALFLNGLYLLGRGFLGSEIFLNPVVEGPFFLPFCLALLTLAHKFFFKEKNWRNILIIVCLFTFFALLYPKGVLPPTPKKVTLWALLFFCFEIMAHACFLVSLIMTWSVWNKKNKKTFFHSYAVWGFVFYSVSQIVGAVWSYYGWGNTFSWSPRHLSSASIWLLYAAYLHLPFLAEWTVKKRAFFIIFSGLFVIFISYGHYLHEMVFQRIGG